MSGVALVRVCQLGVAALRRQLRRVEGRQNAIGTTTA
jgi:hypothetical protein